MLRQFARVLPQTWRNRLRAWQLRGVAAWRDRFEAMAVTHAPPREATLHCRFCSTANARHQVLGEVPLTHPGPFEQTGYRLLHCRACDVVYLDPEPGVRDLWTLYQGSTQFSDDLYSSDTQSSRLTEAYGRRLDQLELVPAAGQSVLEVGAGLAWVSRACKQRCADVHTVAQDVSGECAAQCSWVDHYHVGSVRALPSDRLHALISMTHVIEHLVDPAGMIAELRTRLLPGGKLYVSAPHRPPLWRAGDGIRPWLRYGYLHVPAHIAYLSRTWFDEVAAENGLELIGWDSSHDGHQVLEAVLRKPEAA